MEYSNTTQKCSLLHHSVWYLCSVVQKHSNMATVERLWKRKLGLTKSALFSSTSVVAQLVPLNLLPAE